MAGTDTYWGRAYRPRKVDPAQDARASLYETTWAEVPDFYWAKLTRHAGELTAGALFGVGVVGPQLRTFADPFRP